MRISDKIGYFLTGAAAPGIVWLIVSWIDVIMHNCTDYVYASWNIFKILF